MQTKRQLGCIWFILAGLLLAALAGTAEAKVRLLKSGQVAVDWRDTPILTALNELGDAVGFRVTLPEDAGQNLNSSRKLNLRRHSTPELLLGRLLQSYNHEIRYGSDASIQEVTLLGFKGEPANPEVSAGPAKPAPLAVPRPSPDGVLSIHELNARRLAAVVHGPDYDESAAERFKQEVEQEELLPSDNWKNVDPAMRKTLSLLTRRARAQVEDMAAQLKAAEAQMKAQESGKDK